MQIFMVCGCGDAEISWLKATLVEQTRLVPVNPQLEAIIGLADQMGSGLIFFYIDPSNSDMALLVIEGVVESRPDLAVVAVGESAENALVLGAMRAGARDYLTVGQRRSEVQSLMRRLLRKQPSIIGGSSGPRANVVVLEGTDATADTTWVAAHLALSVAEQHSPVLLIDAAPGLGELEALLNLKCSFGVEDAMSSAQRIDSAVIANVFSRHESGLFVLPLLQDERYPEQYSYAEAILLLGVLRQHFAFIVINACGQADSGFLRALASAADQVLWYVQQSVPCSRRNLERLQRYKTEGITLNRLGLLVDRHLPSVSPTPEVLADTFATPLAAVLPALAEQRLNSLNQGVPLFELAPHSELSRALRRLAKTLLPEPVEEGRGRWRWPRLRR
ncbi:AAA family ATPase [Vreelandella sp. EE27]